MFLSNLCCDSLSNCHAESYVPFPRISLSKRRSLAAIIYAAIHCHAESYVLFPGISLSKCRSLAAMGEVLFGNLERLTITLMNVEALASLRAQQLFLNPITFGVCQDQT